MAVKTKSQPMLELALVAIAISDFNTGDARDSILAVRSIYEIAGEISAAWKAIVTSVAAISGNGMAALLNDFLAIHPHQGRRRSVAHVHSLLGSDKTSTLKSGLRLADREGIRRFDQLVQCHPDQF